MSLTRKTRFVGARPHLTGLSHDELAREAETWLAHVYDVLKGEVVVVPTRTQSVDPEDGELLLDDSILYLALDGEYHQVWPVDPSEVTIMTMAETAIRELFLYRERDVLYLEVDCPVNATTDVVVAVTGKCIAVKRIKVCNPDTATAKEVFFNWGTSTTDDLFKTLLDAAGGTNIENLVGAPCIGDAGEKFTCTVANTGTGNVYVTVGYLLVDPA